MRNEISQAQRVHELPRRARDGSEIERSSPPPRGPASFTRRPCGNARQISPKNAHPVPAPSPHLKKSITSSKLASFQSRIRMKQLLSLCVQPVIQRSCRYARFNSQRGLDLPLGERGRGITISHLSAAPSSQNPEGSSDHRINTARHKILPKRVICVCCGGSVVRSVGLTRARGARGVRQARWWRGGVPDRRRPHSTASPFGSQTHHSRIHARLHLYTSTDLYTSNTCIQ